MAAPEAIWVASRDVRPVATRPAAGSFYRGDGCRDARLRPELPAPGRTHLLGCDAYSGLVLRAAPGRDLSRPQPGLAPPGRAAAAPSGRCGPAGLVAAWLDQGRDGVPPRTHPGGHCAEH